MRSFLGGRLRFSTSKAAPGPLATRASPPSSRVPFAPAQKGSAEMLDLDHGGNLSIDLDRGSSRATAAFLGLSFSRSHVFPSSLLVSLRDDRRSIVRPGSVGDSLAIFHVHSERNVDARSEVHSRPISRDRSRNRLHFDRRRRSSRSLVSPARFTVPVRMIQNGIPTLSRAWPPRVVRVPPL